MPEGTTYRARSLSELIEDIEDCNGRLYRLQHDYRRSRDEEQHRRNSAICVALSLGLTVQNLADAAGLSESRIRQIRNASG